MEKKISGRAKGGAARAEKLTPEKRKSIAMKAVEAKRMKAYLPKSSHRGIIKIGDMEIPCCVLDDGRRLIKEGGITSILGTTGGKNYRLRNNAATQSSGPMPLFLASKPLLPFIHETFGGADLSIVDYIDGGKIVSGFDATILPKVCEVWLKAKDAGTLQPSQLVKAKKAEILMRGLAHIGVIALVDEATGYQKDRTRDALAKILEAYVAKEIQPWIKTFDADYYEQMFRLRGIPYPPEKTNYKPLHFGHLTNNIVYSRLAPGVLEALKEEAKKEAKKTHLHRHLTAGFGRQELLKHLGMVIGFMKNSKNWDAFIDTLDRISPRYNTVMKLDLDYDDVDQ